MAKAKAPRKLHTGPLEIAVGWQGNGGAYQLQPWDQRRVREAFPEAIMIPAIFIHFDESVGYEPFHRPYWPEFARMLTGLTPEQLAHFGGVRLWDSSRHKVLWEWHPEPVTA
jgi:hypothetical protein